MLTLKDQNTLINNEGCYSTADILILEDHISKCLYLFLAPFSRVQDSVPYTVMLQIVL